MRPPAALPKPAVERPGKRFVPQPKPAVEKPGKRMFPQQSSGIFNNY
jgi:hypothetical protein